MDAQRFIDINCDMGESFGVYQLGNDELVIRYITSANVACGFHASDPKVMDRTVRHCKEHHVMVGAHPGYPDMAGFGRRSMDVSQTELVSYILYQVGALKGFLDYYGLPLQHVKLHGALYNYMVSRDEPFLEICEAVKKAFGNIVFLTLGTGRSGALKRAALERGIRIALEAFPDRAYTDEGELLARQKRGAVFKEPEIIAARALTMARSKGIEGANGRWVDMEVDTLCIHGDNTESVEAARRIWELITGEGISVTPLSEFI